MTVRGAMAFLLLAQVAHAGTLRESSLFRAGAVRGSFLSRAMGARAVGMGEAFVAVADDASAVSWNPGGLGQLTALNACAMYDAVAAEMGLTYVAAAMPAGPGVAGCAVTALNYGGYDGRDDAGNPVPGENLMDFGFTASYAYSNHPWFGMKAHTGLALTLAREAVGESLVALGAGVLFPVNPRLTAGFALRNLGPAVGGFDLPAAVQAGVAFTDDPDETGVRMALDFGYGLIDRLTSVKVGAEAFLNPVTILRAGYSRFFEDQGFEDASGLTAGLGVRIGAFGLDYAYQPFGRLARSHRFAVVYRSSSR